MSEGLVLHDKTGAIVDANPAAESMLNCSLAEMRAQEPRAEEWKTIYEDGSQYPTELYPSNEVLRTGGPVRDVVMGIERGQVQRWLKVNAEPLFEQDQLSGVLVTVDDISAEVHFRRELKQRALVMSNLADMAARFYSTATGYSYYAVCCRLSAELWMWMLFICTRIRCNKS